MDAKLYSEYARLESEHWWFIGRRKILESLVRRFHPGQADRALDVGCGAGENARVLLVPRAREVIGIEPSSELAESAHVVCPTMRVLNGFYPNPSVTGTFDVITMLDVLEHIEDDKGVLAELFKQTAPGGVVHLTVPAYQWLWSSHDTLNHHYRRYTRSQIVSLFSETGFEVMKASYFNALLFPMVALVRIAERFGLYKPKDNFGTSGSLLNRPLAFFFALERFLLRSGNLPFGVSIVCVARRPGKLQSF